MSYHWRDTVSELTGILRSSSEEEKMCCDLLVAMKWTELSSGGGKWIAE